MTHMVVVLARPARNQTRTLRTRNVFSNGKIEHGSPKINPKGEGEGEYREVVLTSVP